MRTFQLVLIFTVYRAPRGKGYVGSSSRVSASNAQRLGGCCYGRLSNEIVTLSLRSSQWGRICVGGFGI